MAEFLQILAEQYDYPQLTEEILRFAPPSKDENTVGLISCRELSNKDFNANDTRGPKSVSAFMVKLSELAPRLVIKQMMLLIKLLDSEVMQMCFNYLVYTDGCRHISYAVLSSKSVAT